MFSTTTNKQSKDKTVQAYAVESFDEYEATGHLPMAGMFSTENEKAGAQRARRWIEKNERESKRGCLFDLDDSFRDNAKKAAVVAVGFSLLSAFFD